MGGATRAALAALVAVIACSGDPDESGDNSSAANQAGSGGDAALTSGGTGAAGNGGDSGAPGGGGSAGTSGGSGGVAGSGGDSGAGGTGSADANTGGVSPSGGTGGVPDAGSDVSTGGADSSVGGTGGLDASSGGVGGSDAGASSCKEASPYVCPTNSPPGTPAGLTCTGTTPVISQDGDYAFTTSGASNTNPNGCSHGYADPRTISFALCAPIPVDYELTFKPQPPAAWTPALAVSVRSDCTQQLSCTKLSSSSTPQKVSGTLAAGITKIVLEGYGDVSGIMSVKLVPKTGFVSTKSCAQASAMAPTLVPPAYGYVPLAPVTSESCAPAPTCAGTATEPPSITPFTIAQPAQATLISKSVNAPAASIRSTCANAASDIFCLSPGKGIGTTLLQPGTYYVATSKNTADAGIEAVALHLDVALPPTTNLDCNSAETISTPIGTQFVGTSAHMVGGTADVTKPGRYLRFYKFTLAQQPKYFELDLVPITFAGLADASLRVDCANPATEIAHVAFSILSISPPPPGTYYIVVSADEGTKYYVGLTMQW